MSRSSCYGTTEELRPIGVVGTVKSEVSEVVIDSEFQDGLFRIEENDEIVIVFLFDRSEGYDLRVHPRGDPTIPTVGVFASRSPRRPNRIGITNVRLLEVRQNVLVVEGLDAWEGTPVLDIKPARRRDELGLERPTGKTN